jgi:integrase
MPYKHGKTYWGWVPCRDGGRKRVSLGTDDRVIARDIESLMRQLAGKREWALLDAVVSGQTSAGELYDHAREGADGLVAFRARLSDVDLNQQVDGWRNWATRRASESTVDRYEAQLRILVPADSPFPRSRFTRKAINEALSKLPASGSTARRYHAAWSSFAKYLVEIEIIETNPLRSVTAPRNNPPRELYLSLEDSKRLVEAQPEPYRSIAALREGGGVEISAALKVRRRDVDEKARTVHVHGSKNAWRSRPVFVEDWAWTYIATAAKGKLPDAPLFVEEVGEAVTYYRALAAHRAAVKAVKLPAGYTMHDARHSFAVRCMKAGVDPQLIANNLGHRDATMVLRIYGKYRVTAADFRRALTAAVAQ